MHSRHKASNGVKKYLLSEMKEPQPRPKKVHRDPIAPDPLPNRKVKRKDPADRKPLGAPLPKRTKTERRGAGAGAGGYDSHKGASGVCAAL